MLAALQLPPVAEEVFDMATALNHVDGDLDFIRELATMLNEDAPRLIGDIRNAVDKRDAVLLEKSAHRLRGSLQPFAAPAAIKYAQNLETMGHSQDFSHTTDEYRLLDMEVQRLLAALSTISTPTSSRLPQLTE